MDELIKAIEELKELHKLNDAQFSSSLEIDPSTWSLIKNKGRNPGGKFLRAVMRVYPELKLHVLNYMTAER
jgi:hypothetical protein